MNTLLLNQSNWDLTVDATGNIAMATDPYAPAQDAASACRVFLGEQWYDTTLGIPYFSQILGAFPPQFNLLKAWLVQTSETVPEVISAVAFITAFNRRSVGAQVQLTLTTGTAVFGTNAFGTLWYVNAISPQAAGSLAGGP
jgi:hypothetical protein